MVVSNIRDFCEIERMRAQLEESQKVAATYRDQIKRMQEELLPQAEIIANDPETLNLIYRANKVAKVDTSVLITGETGVGKEEYAKYIHRMSNRSSQPFIRVNCAAISSSLIESELFGYEKGGVHRRQQLRANGVCLKSRITAQYFWMKSVNYRC